MLRLKIKERADWQQKVDALGFFYHSTPEGAYWNESAAYSFSKDEINLIEKSTEELHGLCMEAVNFIVRNDRFEQLRIPQMYIPLIIRSWGRGDPSLYGRFDLQFDGRNPPKMLEYNADTPTSLLEASVVQWRWMSEAFPHCDQFNSIHEKLIAGWKKIGKTTGLIHFACFTEVPEDLGNLEYLRDTAIEAGFGTALVDITEICWDDLKQCFVDPQGRTIETLFKLYPWEWLLEDEFAPYLLNDKLKIIEPAWKVLLSNKGILPILWELFPNHPNLLPAYYKREQLLSESIVRKPFFSREGANIRIEKPEQIITTDGPYQEQGEIFQSYAPLAKYDGNHAVIGSWVVGGQAAGMGIREDRGLITGNLSRFVPHFCEKY